MTVVQEACHEALVIDQFSRQAAPLSKTSGAHDDAIGRLLSATQVNASDIVLDVACGTGQVALAFAAVAKQVTGVDLTPAMIERARSLQREMDVANVRWMVGDVNCLPFEDAAFSVVTCRYAFHHMLDPAGVAAEMTRVCAPGGVVALVDVVTTPDNASAYDRMEWLRDPSHVRALTLEELVGLTKANGLKRVRCEFYRFDVELEALLQASFPAPRDEAKVRDLVVRDLGRNELGVGVSRRGAEFLLSYPIALIVGEVPDQATKN